MLIVIGEGLVQIIDAASEAEWNRALAVTGAGAFALMFGLWAAAVRFGYAGVALLPERGAVRRGCPGRRTWSRRSRSRPSPPSSAAWSPTRTPR